MSGPAGAGIEVDADLTLEVDSGPHGRAAARLTGAGRDLRLVVDRPELLAGSTGRGVVRTVAAGLAAAGVRVEVVGPRGRLAILDPARHSRLAAVVVGSPHVAFGPAIWRLALRVGAPTPSRRAAAAAPVVAVAAVLAVAGLRALLSRGRSRTGRASCK